MNTEIVDMWKSFKDSENVKLRNTKMDEKGLIGCTMVTATRHDETRHSMWRNGNLLFDSGEWGRGIPTSFRKAIEEQVAVDEYRRGK